MAYTIRQPNLNVQHATKAHRTSVSATAQICPHCITQLDLFRHSDTPSRRSCHRRPLADLVDSASVCCICAQICIGLSRGIGFDVDILSDSHLTEFSVEFRHFCPCKTQGKNDVRELHPGATSLRAKLMDWFDDDSYPSTRLIRLKLVKLDIIWDDFHAFNRSYWSSKTPVAFKDRVPTILNWLDVCQSCHERCDTSIAFKKLKPARLIEITEAGNGTQIRLVNRTRIDQQNARYLVLSHCWGGVVPHCRTTRKNLHKHQSAICLSSLPQTFKDAIEVTKTLQVRYLWIDSMCIIQDDEKDWQRESLKMAAIFRGAFLTISATSANTCRGGLGIQSLLMPTNKVDIVLENGRRMRFAVRGRKYNDPWFKMEASPIHRRAWIFQEKILSRRILHITDEQMIWQCATEIESEDGMTDTALTTGKTWHPLYSHLPKHPVRSNHRHFCRLWWSWIDDYTRRALTKSSDKYAAFAGATRLYQEISGDEPIVGLWKRNLVIHLSWRMLATELWKGSIELRVPSWTWMTIPYDNNLLVMPPAYVEQLSPDDTNELEVVYLASVINTRVRWGGEPLVSQPEACSITLQGIICRAIHEPDTRSMRCFREGGLEWSAPPHSARLDSDLAPPELERAYFDAIALYAYKFERKLVRAWQIVFLILKQVEGRANEYRRIGVFSQYSKGSKVNLVDGLGEARQITLV